MHLMQQALDTLRDKDADITDEEYEATLLAILLHDIGHAPFSHLLERTFISSMNHEQFTSLFMDALNRQYEGRLTLAIRIFEDM